MSIKNSNGHFGNSPLTSGVPVAVFMLSLELLQLGSFLIIPTE
jgi:hypothetical protein